MGSKQVITFWIDTEKDADLLTWLDGQTNKSAAIRNAMRGAMHLENDRTTQITEAVSEALTNELARLPDLVARTVKEVLTSYRFAPTQAQMPETDEPAQAAANLDGLLKRLNDGALD